jgi:HEAT repeat protein
MDWVGEGDPAMNTPDTTNFVFALARRSWNADPAVRADAVKALAAYPDEGGAHRALLNRMEDRDENVREAATAALVAIFTARPDLVCELSAELHGEGRLGHRAKGEIGG